MGPPLVRCTKMLDIRSPRLLASLVSGFRPSAREKIYNSQNEGKDYIPGIYILSGIFPTCQLGCTISLYLPTSQP